jgi:hypothetical protein
VSRRIPIFLTILLLLLSSGWSAIGTFAQSDQPDIYLPLVTNGPYSVYLPLILTARLNNTFGVHVKSLDETVAMRAVETKNTWMHINGLYWSGYQPNNGSEFFADPVLEQELIKADQSGMKAILVIHRTPLWAREYSDSVCGPIKRDMLDEFANFMAMVVQKYSQAPYNVEYYELWNEPDLPLVQDKPATPGDESNIPYGCWGDVNAEDFGGGYYAEMLNIVAPAIRSVNSNAKIVLGGLLMDCHSSWVPCSSYWGWRSAGFFEGILRAGGGANFDVVNFHAYNYYSSGISPIQMEYETPYWAGVGGQVEGKLSFLKQVMSNYGVDKPVILTEAGLLCVGCPTYTDDYQQDKAEYLVWLYTRNWSKGIMATIWYHLDKGGWQGTGLLDAQNNPLPAFYAYKTMTNMLYEANFTREVNNEVGARIFEFDKGFKIWVLFSMDGNSKMIDLSPYGPIGNVEAYDLFGNLCGAVGTDCILHGSQLTFDLPVFLHFH